MMRNNKGLATLTIVLIIVAAVVVVGGVVGGVVGYNAYQERKQQEAIKELEETEKAREAAKPKNILGIVIDSGISDFSQNDVQELCNILGLTYSDFDKWEYIGTNKDNAESTIKTFVTDKKCTSLILASSEFKEVEESIKGQNPNINIYITQTQRLENAKKEKAIASMVMTKSQAQNAGGFYILRGDQYIDIGKQQRDDYVFSFFRAYGYTNWRHNAVMILKDYTYPYIVEGDKLVAFSGSSKTPIFYLDKVRELNYTIPVTWNSAGGFMDIMEYIEKGKPYYGQKPKYPDTVLADGEKLKDKFTNENLIPFETGVDVKLTWYEGTQYHEEIKKASYKYYNFYDRTSWDDYDENHISPNGVVGTEGYAEYDLSSVQNGLYWLHPLDSQDGSKIVYSGFIEINR